MCKFGFVGVIADDKRLSQYYKSSQSCRDGYHPPVRFVLFYWHAPCKSYHERRRATPPQSQLTPSRLLLQGRLIDSATNPNLPISQRYILNNTSLATHQYKAKNPTQRKTVGRILALLYASPNFLFYRDDNEAVCKLFASVNCVLRENIGTAAAGARASEEAVDVNCRRVLGVEVVAVH